MQYVALLRLARVLDFGALHILHFAPEALFGQFMKSHFASYVTADIEMEGVDHKVDLRKLPFGDQSFDVVYASHVLEHIDDDIAALAEIRRVLRPSGLAILPVPVIADKTVEYPEPNPHEAGHVRAPGPDYFDRYREFFATVVIVSSSSCRPEFQCFAYEDRSRWPTEKMPLRRATAGDRHEEFVPICFVSRPDSEVARQIVAADV